MTLDAVATAAIAPSNPRRSMPKPPKTRAGTDRQRAGAIQRTRNGPVGAWLSLQARAPVALNGPDVSLAAERSLENASMDFAAERTAREVPSEIRTA
jgi:hypothetical protein